MSEFENTPKTEDKAPDLTENTENQILPAEADEALPEVPVNEASAGNEAKKAFCSECGAEIEADAAFCPSCGQKRKKGYTVPKKTKSERLINIVNVILGLLTAAGLVEAVICFRNADKAFELLCSLF